MPAISPRRQELETAKEILAEVFGARPSDVDEMTTARQRRSFGSSKVAAFKLCHC